MSRWVVLLLVVTQGAVLFGASIRTPFIEAVMTDVSVGQEVRVTSAAGDGLFLSNPGHQPVRVMIQVRPPTKAELRSGAIPIPHSDWVRLESTQVSIPAQGSVRVLLWITVPNERRFRRKAFQAMIVSTLLVDSGKAMVIQAGLTSRVRINTR